MQFRVRGAVQETGTEISTTISALDSEGAEVVARRRGILVAEIVPSKGENGNAQTAEENELSQLKRQTEHLRVIRGWVTFIGVLYAIAVVVWVLDVGIGLLVAAMHSAHR